MFLAESPNKIDNIVAGSYEELKKSTIKTDIKLPFKVSDCFGYVTHS